MTSYGKLPCTKLEIKKKKMYKIFFNRIPIKYVLVHTVLFFKSKTESMSSHISASIH